MTTKEQRKQQFLSQLHEFVTSLNSYVSTEDGQWTIKGFIDMYKNIYTISSDTKIVSKILEIHLFPQILKFAEQHEYAIVLPEHQNYYPDLSFIDHHDPTIKFAVDFKTTYRLPHAKDYCNGFTLGSHGEYFTTRTSRKNIQFPYSEYLGHYCLGIIYSRAVNRDLDDTARPIRLTISIRLSPSSRILSFLLWKSGKLQAIKVEVVTPPISEVLPTSPIFFPGMACLRNLVKRGLMITG